MKEKSTKMLNNVGIMDKLCISETHLKDKKSYSFNHWNGMEFETLAHHLFLGIAHGADGWWTPHQLKQKIFSVIADENTSPSKTQQY